MRRDTCEANEAILRRPYYTLKPEIANLATLRENLVFPNVVGPQLSEVDVPEPTHAKLTPNYTESWVFTPPHRRTRQ